MKTTLIAGAYIVRDEQLLLVEQQGPEDPAPSWALPGGRVHDGEFFTDALVREVYEETGLIVEKIGGLVYTNHLIDVVNQRQLVAHVYQVDVCYGELKPQDPDEFIRQVRFVTLAEAADLIEATQPYRPMQEPIVAFLRGLVPYNTAWQYQRQPDGTARLVCRLI